MTQLERDGASKGPLVPKELDRLARQLLTATKGQGTYVDLLQAMDDDPTFDSYSAEHANAVAQHAIDLRESGAWVKPEDRQVENPVLQPIAPLPGRGPARIPADVASPGAKKDRGPTPPGTGSKDPALLAYIEECFRQGDLPEAPGQAMAMYEARTADLEKVTWGAFRRAYGIVRKERDATPEPLRVTPLIRRAREIAGILPEIEGSEVNEVVMLQETPVVPEASPPDAHIPAAPSSPAVPDLRHTPDHGTSTVDLPYRRINASLPGDRSFQLEAPRDLNRNEAKFIVNYLGDLFAMDGAVK